MGFVSTGAVPGGSAAPGEPKAGTAPPAPVKNGKDCEIIFEATRVSTIDNVNKGLANPDYTNSLAKARINNWFQVAWIDLDEFNKPGATRCSPLTNTLGIRYTVDHEFLGNWSLKVSSASGKELTNAPPPGTNATDRGAWGTHSQNIEEWPTCSYTATLSTVLRLTTGLANDQGGSIPVTFCIGLKS
jgi:hypothetical protein